MERILQLLGMAPQSGIPPEAQCIVRLARDGVQMELLEYQLPCGHTAYLVKLAFRAGETGAWVPIGSLRDFTWDGSISLLTQARQCIADLRG